MIRTSLCLLFLVALAPGCGVQAGNPGSGKFTLSGTIRASEDNSALVREVRLLDDGGTPVAATRSNANGHYRIQSLDDGAYRLHVGEAFEEPVRVEGDTVHDVRLPVPAAPGNARFVDVGAWRGICFLWEDRSGVEREFIIEGPRGFRTHDNLVGLYENPEELDRWAFQREENELSLENWRELADRWNSLYAGTYVITAVNEFGSSAPASVMVPPLDDSDPWSFPETADVAACAPQSGLGIYYITKD